jgi:ankyrin repeat protein
MTHSSASTPLTARALAERASSSSLSSSSSTSPPATTTVYNANLLNNGASLTKQRRPKDYNLHDFARLGDLDGVRQQLDHIALLNPAYINTPDIVTKQTALHTAAANGDLPLLTLLLERNAAPDVTDCEEQRTALWLACHHGHEQATLLLVKTGANIDLADKAKMTPAMAAAEGGHNRCLQHLLRHGAQADPTTECFGQSALHLAAAGGHLDCVHLLMDAGADRDRLDAFERSPEETAVSRGHAAVSQLLQLADEAELARTHKITCSFFGGVNVRPFPCKAVGSASVLGNVCVSLSLLSCVFLCSAPANLTINMQLHTERGVEVALSAPFRSRPRRRKSARLLVCYCAGLLSAFNRVCARRTCYQWT